MTKDKRPLTETGPPKEQKKQKRLTLDVDEIKAAPRGYIPIGPVSKWYYGDGKYRRKEGDPIFHFPKVNHDISVAFKQHPIYASPSLGDVKTMHYYTNDRDSFKGGALYTSKPKSFDKEDLYYTNKYYADKATLKRKKDVWSPLFDDASLNSDVVLDSDVD